MKRKSFLIPAAAFALLLSLGLAACGGGGQEGGKESTPQQQSGKQESIKVTAAGDKKTLILGETVQLTADQDGVTWQSEKPEIADVNQSGLVTSFAVGSAKIVAKKDGFKDGSITIKVELEKITITANGSTELLAGQTVQLTASKDGVTWASSDEGVATVSNAGLVTAVKFGTATITAAKEGLETGKITINVVRPAANIIVDMTSGADHYSADGWWELPSSGGGFSFAMQSVDGPTPIAQPISYMTQEENPDTFVGGFGEGDKETVKFSSSKAVKAEIVLDIGNSSEVVLGSVMSAKLNDKTIDLSEVTLEAHAGDWGNTLTFGELSLGELDIVSGENTLEFGFLAATNIFLNEVHLYAGDATVTLVPPALKEQIVISATETEVIEEQTIQLNASVADVTWMSLDEQVATVDQTGKVTGVKMGKVNIRAKKEGMYSVQVEITVNPKPVEGQILIEAESAAELADVVPGEYNMSGGAMIMTDGGQWGGSEVHSGGAYVTGYGVSDLTLTFTFNAPADATMTLSVVGASSAMKSDYSGYEAQALADIMTITLNENPVDVGTAAFPEGGSMMSNPMSEVVIGDVSVKKDVNTLVVQLSSLPSLDVFKLSVK